MKAHNQIVGIKFDKTGNIIKPKVPKLIKQKFEKIDNSNKMAILQPQQVQMKNGEHLICRFCSCSHFTIANLMRHTKLKHKTELVEWFITRKFQELYGVDKDITAISEVARQQTYATATYELNQVM